MVKLKNKNWVFIVLVLIIYIVIFHGIFFKRLAYSDFTPFSDNFIFSWNKFFYLWSDGVVGSFSADYLYFFRAVVEFVSFNMPLLAQVIFLIVPILIGHWGFKKIFSNIGLSHGVSILLPILYFVNPVFVAEMSNGATGTVILYALIPVLYLFFINTLIYGKLRELVILGILIAIFLINIQTAFWIFIGFIPMIIFLFIHKKTSLLNIFKTILASSIGFIASIVSLASFFAIAGNFSNISYLNTFKHTYHESTFLNIYTLASNWGSSLQFLGYFDNSLSIIIPLIIFSFIVSQFIFIKKSFSMYALSIRNSILTSFFLLAGLMYGIHINLFNDLIEAKNILLVSVRNPQKLLYLFSFLYITLIGFSFLAFKKFLKKKSVLLVCIFIVFVFIQNKIVLNGDFGLTNVRGDNTFFITQKYNTLFDFTKNHPNSSFMYLPFDYSIQQRVVWQKNIFYQKLGAAMLQDDGNIDLLSEYYSNLCNEYSNIKMPVQIDYFILDKDPKTYKKHSTTECSVIGSYGNSYIWGTFNYFMNKFKDFPVVYEDNNFLIVKNEQVITRRKIDTIDSLFSVIFFKNLEAKYSFVNDILKDDFDFVVKNEKKNIPTEKVDHIFENLDWNYLKDGVVKQYIKKTLQDDLYVNQGKKDLQLVVDDGRLVIKDVLQEHLFANGKDISLGDNQADENKVLYSTELNADDKYYVQNGEEVFAVKNNIRLNENVPVKIYKSQDNNIINNSSFENGLWQEKVGDCNAYDDNSILKMQSSDNASDGDKSLELQATKHIACTSQKGLKVESGQTYLLSFDYQSDDAKQGGFYVGFQGKKDSVSGKLPITDEQWRNYSQVITVPEGVDRLSLYVYAYETDGEKNNIVRYDNFDLQKLELVKEILPKEKNEFAKVDLPKVDDEQYVFEYKDSDYNYKNLIPNASLEGGLWSKRVGDCNNYDRKPILKMIESDNTSDGNKSLELQATRHAACTGPGIISVKGGVDYLLEFDYQSNNAKRAGVYLGFNDEEKSNISEKINIKDNEWHTYSKKITVPVGATTASLNVYSYSKDEKTNIVTRYDNFKLIELPNLNNRYYLVSESPVETAKPNSVEFDLINPTKKLVHIKGATKPFYLTMSESYHDKWQAQLNNDKVNGFFKSWVPFVKPDTISNDKHFKYMTFSNGWYINPQELCEVTQPKAGQSTTERSGCTKNNDGSYDIEMVIEFTPQRWFYLGLLISGTTFVLLIGYLGCDFIKRRMLKNGKWKRA